MSSESENENAGGGRPAPADAYSGALMALGQKRYTQAAFQVLLRGAMETESTSYSAARSVSSAASSGSKPARQ